MAVELQNTILRDDGNLVAYWRLEDVSAEVGGFTLTNNNTVAFNADKFNNGADQGASNTNKFLSILDNLGIGSGSCTLNLWVNLNTDIATDGQARLLTLENGTTHNRYNITYVDTSGTKSLLFERVKQGVGNQSFSANNNLGTGTSHMVSFTFNGSTIEGFVDGTSIGSTAASGDGSSGLTDLFYIGMHEDGTSIPSSAIDDDVSVFSRDLSATEIGALYNGTLAGRGAVANNGYAFII